MKRMLCLLLVGLMAMVAGGLCLPGFAEPRTVDLETMSLEELKELQVQVNLAMWVTEEWQEVVVPKGVYEIGVEIPAGLWAIRPVEDKHGFVFWGKEKNEYGTELKTLIASEIISSASGTRVTWELVEGTYFSNHMDVIFTPYNGPSFIFK